MNLQKPPRAIEWTRRVLADGTILPGYTSNPVRGCMHRCEWRMPDGNIARCYAKDVALRIGGKAYPNGFESLSFHPEEFAAWRTLKEPAGIFCDSMSDLFGSKVPDGWISETLDAMESCPQHTFMSLTKNPPRLKDFDFPDNLWMGVSAPPTFMHGGELTQEQQQQWFKRAMEILKDVRAKVRWVSLEPLSSDLTDILVECEWLDWAIIGAASNGRKTFQPAKDVFSKTIGVLAPTPIFFKGNIDRKLADEVASGWRAEFPNP